jgi:integrase
MPEAKFILKEPKSDKETLVYLQYHFDYKKLKWSTGEKIHPKNWNVDKQRAKSIKTFIEHPEFNTRLNNIETGVNNAYRRLKNDGLTITPESLKRELLKNLDIIKEVDIKVTLTSFIKDFIEQSKNNKQAGTISVYNTTLSHLNAYAEKKRKKIDFDSITMDFYIDFKEFLLKKGFTNNTIGKYIKTLKAFLREAEERGISVPKDFKSKRFKVDKEDGDHIYLNEDELKKLYLLELEQEYLSRTRDLFLIGCYTGLRFSDFSQLTNEHISTDSSGKSMIKIRTQKTGTQVSIPMHPIVKTIMTKYGDTLPRVITNQKMNEYLKIIGKEAEITDPVLKTISKGNHKEKVSFEKWRLISTHTARRSFATNAYRRGVPTIGIMKITGHSTEKSFMKYIKFSQDENALSLSEHEFFKN